MKIESARSRIAFFCRLRFPACERAFADFSGQFVVTNWTISTQVVGCGAARRSTLQEHQLPWR